MSESELESARSVGSVDRGVMIGWVVLLLVLQAIPWGYPLIAASLMPGAASERVAVLRVGRDPVRVVLPGHGPSPAVGLVAQSEAPRLQLRPAVGLGPTAASPWPGMARAIVEVVELPGGQWGAAVRVPGEGRLELLRFDAERFHQRMALREGGGLLPWMPRAPSGRLDGALRVSTADETLRITPAGPEVVLSHERLSWALLLAWFVWVTLANREGRLISVVQACVVAAVAVVAFWLG